MSSYNSIQLNLQNSKENVENLTQLDDKILSIYNAISSLNVESDQILDLKKQNQLLKDKLKMFRDRCRDLEKRQLELQELLKEHSSDIASNLDESFNSNLKLDEILELYEQIQELKSSEASRKTSLIKFKTEFRSEIENLKTELAAKCEISQKQEKQLDEQKTLTNQLQEDFETIKAENEQLKASCKIYEDDISFLEEQISFFKYDCDDKEHDLAEIMKGKELFQQEFEKLEGKIEVLDLELFKKDEKIAQSLAQIESLSEQNENLKKEKREFKKILQYDVNKSNTREKITKELHSLKNKLESANNRIRYLEEKNKSLAAHKKSETQLFLKYISESKATVQELFQMGAGDH